VTDTSLLVEAALSVDDASLLVIDSDDGEPDEDTSPLEGVALSVADD
jgi:hypothetical protein